MDGVIYSDFKIRHVSNHALKILIISSKRAINTFVNSANQLNTQFVSDVEAIILFVFFSAVRIKSLVLSVGKTPVPGD